MAERTRARAALANPLGEPPPTLLASSLLRLRLVAVSAAIVALALASPSVSAGYDFALEVPRREGTEADPFAEYFAQRQLRDNSSSGSVTFFVIGDWGRDGAHGQREVAEAMAKIASSDSGDDGADPLAFVISTGDNFYNQKGGGLSSVDDDQFDTSFASMYSKDALAVPWFAVLGNHDYGDISGCSNGTSGDSQCGSIQPSESRSPDYQINPWLRKQRDWRWFCERYYAVSITPFLRIVFMDTSPFINEYYNYSWAFDVEGGLASQSIADQLNFAASALESNDGNASGGGENIRAWKFVVGHHPVYSNGYRGGQSDVRDVLGGLLRQSDVAFYVNGHDHDLQHIYPNDSTTHFITSGAGSKTGRGFGTLDTKFEYDASGFAAFTVRPNDVTLRFYDADANQIYEQIFRRS
mmetsp:Transcript_9207/g.23643  ORF Transcript_9207/g.23643 Transcript_9207/m.23643 type:complete len:411 (+) Transcript_9207:154-1386(+)